jgi:hypothetical protein
VKAKANPYLQHLQPCPCYLLALWDGKWRSSGFRFAPHGQVFQEPALGKGSIFFCHPFHPGQLKVKVEKECSVMMAKRQIKLLLQGPAIEIAGLAPGADGFPSQVIRP